MGAGNTGPAPDVSARNVDVISGEFIENGDSATSLVVAISQAKTSSSNLKSACGTGKPDTEAG
jgi:hypothetical protein